MKHILLLIFGKYCKEKGLSQSAVMKEASLFMRTVAFMQNASSAFKEKCHIKV